MIVEKLEDSWVLLEMPCSGRIGLMKKVGIEPKDWPHPIIALRSDEIENDVSSLARKGLNLSPISKTKDMWFASHKDSHGNQLLIWQEPEKKS